MKKVLLFSVFAFLFSCSNKDAVAPLESVNSGMLLLAKVSGVENTETKYLVYSSLTPDEKYSLWTAKLGDRIRSSELSTIQANKLLEIKNYLSPEIFKEGMKREIFYTHWFPEWVTGAEKVLSREEIYLSIFSINGKSKARGNGLQQELPPSTMACICALNATYTCPKWTLGLEPVLTFGKCFLSAADCVEKSGCGALWDNECDGDICDNSTSVD